MSKHTRAEWAKICKLNPNTARAYISTNIKRGNIVVNEDGEIDDTHPVNAAFLAKARENNREKAPEPVTRGRDADPEEDSEDSLSPEESKDIFLKLKKQEYDKKVVETRILEIKEQKMRGEVIPIEIIRGLFAQHSQSITTEFKNSVESMLTIIAKKKSLNGNEVAEIRSQLVSTINLAVDKAIEYTRKNVDSIVVEFSIKKEVGERE